MEIRSSGIPELDDYIAYLSETPQRSEQEYAWQLWACLQDDIDSEWPETADHCLSFHRGLEVLGVLEYYHSMASEQQKQELRTERVPYVKSAR
jgi:hypothetical protein